MNKKAFISTCLVVGLAGGLAACGSGDNSTPVGTGNFRFVNAVTDSGSATAQLSTSTANIAQVTENANTASGNKTVPKGSYKIDLSASGLTGTSVDNVSIDQDSVTTVFAVGNVAANSFGGFAAEVSITTPTSGQFVVQYINASYAEQASVGTTLSFYLVPHGDAFQGAGPTSVTYGVTPPPATTIADGTYDIYVTDGSANIVYCNTTQSLPLTNTNVLQIAAIDDPALTNGSLMQLIALDNTGGTTNLLDTCPIVTVLP